MNQYYHGVWSPKYAWVSITYSPSHSLFLPRTTRYHEFWWHHPSSQWAYSHHQHHDEPSQQCSTSLYKIASLNHFTTFVSYSKIIFTSVLLEVGFPETLPRLASSEHSRHSWKWVLEAQEPLSFIAGNLLSLGQIIWTSVTSAWCIYVMTFLQSNTAWTASNSPPSPPPPIFHEIELIILVFMVWVATSLAIHLPYHPLALAPLQKMASLRNQASFQIEEEVWSLCHQSLQKWK